MGKSNLIMRCVKPDKTQNLNICKKGYSTQETKYQLEGDEVIDVQFFYSRLLGNTSITLQT